MTPARLKEVQALFEAVLAEKESDRTAYLAVACREDEDLYAEVSSLLNAHDAPASLLDGNVLDSVDSLNLSEHLSLEGKQIGPYRLLRQIGEGGMGLVYLAERADGMFEQQVALKLIKRGMDTAQIVRRFEAERQILAKLQHEHIARLLDGGVTQDGLPYFVMEYVDGMPIDRYCDTHQVSIDKRLDLFVTVCKTVLFAHANLVVHRDLKPENILVTGDGKVKLLDFGIAKVLGNGEDETQLTQQGSRVLTPAYASPEQMRGALISTSSDIYSLGVVLYELLAGKRPYDTASLAVVAPSLPDTEPERPSTLVERAIRDKDTASVETISRARGTQPEKLRRLLTGDLDVICLKALRPEPARRYGSVEAFSEDIQRHRAGMPVLARPDTPGYRIQKFLQRHRAGVVISTTFVLLITTLVSFYTIRLAEERDRAQSEADKALQVSEFLQQIFEVSNPSTAKGESVTARELLDNGAAQLATELADQPDIQATMYDVIGNVYRELGLYDQAAAMHLEALNNKKLLFGEDHIEVAASLNLLGQTYRRISNYPAADSAYRAALEIQRKHLGEEHEEVAESLANLAVVLRRMGNETEAEAMVRESLRQRNKLLGPDHMEVAATMNNLAIILSQRSALSEADSLYELVIEILKKEVGDAHPGVASTYNNRAYIRSQLGDFAGAVELYSASLSVKRKLYGSEHPTLIVTLNNIGSTLINQQKYDEAEVFIAEGMEIGKKAYNKPHPNRSGSLSHMASILLGRKAYPEAEALRREAIQIQRAVYGEKHHSIATSMYGIAELLSLQGKHAEAEALQREGLAMSRELPDDGEDLRVARDLEGLADILMRAEKEDEAMPLLRGALDLRIKLQGDEHKQVARLQGRLAEISSGL